MSKNNKPNLYTLFAFILALLLPILIIPIINNPFFNSKALLLFVLAIGTLVAYIFQSFKEKKWLISSNPLVLPLIVFGGSILLSSLISHQYPFDQLVGWGGLFLSFVTIIIFAPTLIKNDYAHKLIQIMNIAGLIIALNSLLQLFGLGFSQIFAKLSVFKFTNDLSFNLAGGISPSVQFLSALIIANLLSKTHREKLWQKAIIACLVLGLGINLYAMLPGKETSPQLLSLPASIAIAKESLAVSRTALFGYGPNSYGQAFFLLKPVWLNSTNLWQYSFENAIAFPLTLIVSGGLLAFLSWLFLISRTIRLVNVKKDQQASALKYFIIAAIVWQIISPLSVVMLGLLALATSFYLASNLDSYKIKKFSFNKLFDPFNLQPNNKASLYSFTAISAIMMAGVIFLSYQVGRHFAAHFLAYQGVVAAEKEEYNLVFAKQEQSRNLASRSALWRRNYAVSSLELAVALSNKTDITAPEQQQVLELVNLAITEAKAATLLQPKFYQNWLVLANIYSQLLEVTEDAGQLAFESIAQAVMTNPNDPFMRINLGQLLMRFERWEEAINFFTQAVERKPDLAAAYYNLAQAYLQNTQVLEAENALQQTLLLIDKETNLEDYTTVETQLATVTKQADQLRAQQADTQTMPVEAQNPTKLNLEGQGVDSPGSITETKPIVEEDTGLSNLLDEQKTSDLLRQGILTSEEEALN